VALPCSGGVVDLLSPMPGAWLAAEVSAAALAVTLTEALQTLQTGERFDRSYATNVDLAETTAAHRGGEFKGADGQFQFARAIECYEALIDQTCAAGRPDARGPTDSDCGSHWRRRAAGDGIGQGTEETRLASECCCPSGTGGAAAEELLKAGIGFVSLHMRKGLADPRAGFSSTAGYAARGRQYFMRIYLMRHGWLAGRYWAGVQPSALKFLRDRHAAQRIDRIAGRRLGYRLSRFIPYKVTR